MDLHSLENTTRPFKRRRRVGRGMGSGLGKTSGRGVKGAGSRSGYKTRARYEGGQIPLYKRLPERGFSNARFQRKLDSINLEQINAMFADGDLVSLETLKQAGFLKGESFGIKVLAKGELKKKVKLEIAHLSAQAEEKLKANGISYKIV